jgi:hypothetical protein
MLKTFTVAAALLATAPALACDQAKLNALKDQVRALERQAESLRQLERIERDRNRMIDWEIRNRRS